MELGRLENKIKATKRWLQKPDDESEILLSTGELHETDHKSNPPKHKPRAFSTGARGETVKDAKSIDLLYEIPSLTTLPNPNPMATKEEIVEILARSLVRRRFNAGETVGLNGMVLLCYGTAWYGTV